MAALAKDRNTPSREGARIVVPVKAATKIYAGSLVAKESGGYAAPASKATGLAVLGRAEEQVDNSSGDDGAANVTVQRGTFKWANAAAADAVAKTEIGEDAYALDDQTVTKTKAGASKAGKILGVEPDGVWVETL